MSLLIAGTLGSIKNDADYKRLSDLATNRSLSFTDIARALVRYNGNLHSGVMAGLSERLTALRPDLFADPASAAELLRDGGFANLAAVREVAGDYDTYDVADESIFEYQELLPQIPNVHRSDELPLPLGRHLSQPDCPKFTLISSNVGTLFCAPWGFQLFNQLQRTYVASASTRPLTTTIQDLPRVPIERNIVIIQDKFHGFNFAHFLFDRCIRIFAFAEHAGVAPRDCLFVMGGFPAEFHRLVVNAMCRMLGLDYENFYFPSAEVLLRSTARTFWFSDTMGPDAHPAQLFRSAATRWLRALARDVLGEPVALNRRLYITRRDVNRRCLANENDFYRLLNDQGFDYVNLSNMRLIDQIRLLASASCVVSAHGMGLTLLSFNAGAPALVELHHPKIGTDAYALMSKGLGFAYTPVFGTPSRENENFTVDIEKVMPLLPPGPTTPERVAARQAATLDFAPEERWLPGAQESPVADFVDMPPPVAGRPVVRHTRRNEQADSNIGYWLIPRFRFGALYSIRCFVYVPTGSAIRRLYMTVGNWPSMIAVADLSMRDCWQCLAVSGTCPPGRESANIVLRMFGDAGCWVFSCDWVVTGDVPDEPPAA